MFQVPSFINSNVIKQTPSNTALKSKSTNVSRKVLIHTAAVFRDFARKGFTEGMSGHISVRDPEFENYIWMNPLGRHFGLMTAGDLICFDVHTGKVVGGNRVRYFPCLILFLPSLQLFLKPVDWLSQMPTD